MYPVYIRLTFTTMYPVYIRLTITTMYPVYTRLAVVKVPCLSIRTYAVKSFSNTNIVKINTRFSSVRLSEKRVRGIANNCSQITQSFVHRFTAITINIMNNIIQI